MSEESASGSAVAERIRASEIAVNGSSSVEAMLANALRERKPLADDGALHDTVQEAENAASSFVFVPPGTFNESVTIDTAGLTLLGSGNATVISGTSISVSSDVGNVTVKDIQTKNSDGISLSGANSKILNCYMDSGDGIGFRVNAANSIIQNCTVKNVGNRGIRLEGVRSTAIANTVDSVGSNVASGYGIQSGTDDMIVANNIVRNADFDGIFIQGNDSIVIGNRCHNNGDDGIEIASTATDCITANNRCSDNGFNDINDVGTGTTLDGNLTGSAN